MIINEAMSKNYNQEPPTIYINFGYSLSPIKPTTADKQPCPNHENWEKSSAPTELGYIPHLPRWDSNIQIPEREKMARLNDGIWITQEELFV